jgi:hypothetical protein
VHELPDKRLRIWPHVPDGAIVVVDEVQRFWRQRPQGAEVPREVQAIETHRHFGLDLFFISQDPKLVDVNVRKLCWEHTHIKRIFGSEKATLFRWKQRVASPDSKADYSDALEELWAYPRDVYPLYKSAEVHTATKQLPVRQMVIGGVLLSAVIAAVWWVFWSFADEYGEGSKAQASSSSPADQGERAAPPRGRRVLGANVWDPSQRTPRVQGFPNSAALFDGLQDVRAQPSVAGCMRIDYVDTGRIDCRCLTGQGTRIEMTTRQCIELVEKGWFDPTKEAVDVKAENIAYLNRRDSAGSFGGGVADEGSSRPVKGGGINASSTVD